MSHPSHRHKRYVAGGSLVSCSKYTAILDPTDSTWSDSAHTCCIACDDCCKHPSHFILFSPSRPPRRTWCSEKEKGEISRMRRRDRRPRTGFHCWNEVLSTFARSSGKWWSTTWIAVCQGRVTASAWTGRLIDSEFETCHYCGSAYTEGIHHLTTGPIQNFASDQYGHTWSRRTNMTSGGAPPPTTLVGRVDKAQVRHMKT